MALLCQDIINHIETLCPPKLAYEWDNVGLLVGDREQAVSKILVALDATNEVVEEAVQANANMIVTHHPLFNPKWNGPMKSITMDNRLGKLLYILIKNNISLYSAHTNLDVANGGINDVLANLFALKNVFPLELLDQDEINGLGRVGELFEKIPAVVFAQKVKDELGIETLRFIGQADKMIKKVAICSGAGSGLLKQAALIGADILITGDMKYHEAQEAQNLGINVIDAGHYETERVIVPVLKEYIEKLDGLEVLESSLDGNPFKIL